MKKLLKMFMRFYFFILLIGCQYQTIFSMNNQGAPQPQITMNVQTPSPQQSTPADIQSKPPQVSSTNAPYAIPSIYFGN